MVIKTDISNTLNSEFRNTLNENFSEIDYRLNSLNTLFSSIDNQSKKAVISELENVYKIIDGMKDIVNNIIVGSDAGDSSIEVSISRTNVHGKEYQTIGARIDAIEKAIIKQGGNIDV